MIKNKENKKMIAGNINELRESAIEKVAEKRFSDLSLDEYEAMSQGIQKLLEYEGSDRVISNSDYWTEKGTLTKEILTFHPEIWGLDNYTKGFQLGELWIVSGPTKHGKTTLCETIGKDILKQGGKCLWFFYEMPEQFMERHKDEDGIFYIPRERKANSLTWICDRILEAKLKYDIKAVFIDHLHYVVGFENLMRNSSISIGQTVRTLKSEIAVNLGLLVFLVAHTTKVDFTEELNESDIRDSSFVSQEADGTIMVYRRLKKDKTLSDNDPYSNTSRLIVCNSRRSGVIRAKVNLVKQGNYLYEEAKSDELV
jgi:replicative DNA helicase